ncbi:MAG: hypothetical protein IKT58_04955 [Oscillospiraceae bacterium]|nr:hypothetical protein [Oscillospiraceae bacterium]
MKNLKKKALVPAIAMVLASVIALSGVTYAWFTTGNTATVETLNVNVQTANGIQVSLDAESWRSIITAEDIEEAVKNTNLLVQYPKTSIVPVSSAGNVTNGRLELFLGNYREDDGNLKSTALEDTRATENVNYVAFDLYFQSSMEQDLTLNIGPSASYVKGVALKEGRNEKAGAEKAVRVALLPMGTYNEEVDESPLALTGDGTCYIWEPNATERADGVNVDKGNKVPYSGFKTTFESVAEAELGDSEVSPVETFIGDQKIITLQPGISKVRVYIWLEGQDVDCINNISFGDFCVNLLFSVPKKG